MTDREGSKEGVTSCSAYPGVRRVWGEGGDVLGGDVARELETSSSEFLQPLFLLFTYVKGCLHARRGHHLLISTMVVPLSHKVSCKLRSSVPDFRKGPPGRIKTKSSLSQQNHFKAQISVVDIEVLEK